MSRLSIPNRRWTFDEVRDWLNELARRDIRGSFTWDAPNVPANDEVTTTLTTSTVAALEGLRNTHCVSVNPPATIDAGIAVSAAWVPASDQLAIRLRNHTGSDINPASGTWLFHGVIV